MKVPILFEEANGVQQRNRVMKAPRGPASADLHKSGRPEKDAIDLERTFSLLPQAVALGSMQTDVRLIRINGDESQCA
jgi:hypothetical protein